MADLQALPPELFTFVAIMAGTLAGAGMILLLSIGVGGLISSFLEWLM